ncbi:hypothetical protein TNCV_4748141 [Trichonephila clavipes]|nr:hypothetical protein TNCV_4748141 [Trichonephila clavipes]
MVDFRFWTVPPPEPILAVRAPRGISGSVSHPTEKGDAFPTPGRRQCTHKYIMGPSESVQEFAARINKLGTQIFQSGNSAQNTAVRNANDQLLQSRFISGLRNDIRRFVLSRDPLNLEQSINAALIEEQNMKLNQIASEENPACRPHKRKIQFFQH